LLIEPIDLSIDEVELVVGGGSPYGYQTLGKWVLSPESDRMTQGGLFSA